VFVVLSHSRTGNLLFSSIVLRAKYTPPATRASMDRMSRTLPFSAALLVLALSAAAQDKGVAGNWRTPGGAVVRVAPCGADVCATLLQLEPNAPTRFDEKNPDPAKHTRELCGEQIGYGFHLTDPSHAEDGHLYDPKSGKTYKGVMTAEGDQLHLRGYVGIKAFGRTEEWTRTAQTPTCKS
jgi:uncharacterized protein (DUF2147 family)